jgi:flagellar protein FlbD
MITLTTLDTKPLAVDPDQIERAEATPGTVLTMVDGTTHMVTEGIGEVIDLIRKFRASLVAGSRPLPGRVEAPVTELRAVASRHGRRR